MSTIRLDKNDKLYHHSLYRNTNAVKSAQLKTENRNNIMCKYIVIIHENNYCVMFVFIY